MGFPGGSVVKTLLLCKRPGFDPRGRAWQPTPGVLPGKSHGQKSLVGYSPWGCKGSDMTEQLSTRDSALGGVMSVLASQGDDSGVSEENELERGGLGVREPTGGCGWDLDKTCSFRTTEEAEGKRSGQIKMTPSTGLGDRLDSDAGGEGW